MTGAFSMKRTTVASLSLAALLISGGAMAAGSDSGQQAPANQNTPATGSASNATPPSVSAQSTGQYPGARGPTGSTQPDATNPVRSNPSGGGGQGR